MRVVAGKIKGRRLIAPEGNALRPTSDRVRESVFNIMAHREGLDLGDAQVLDGFAGTGAMGIEALSRGAARAIFLENDRTALEVCRKNLETLIDERDSWSVRHADCLAPPPAVTPCTHIFLDPPYGLGLAAPSITALHRSGWIADGACCIVEISTKETFDPPIGFTTTDIRRYGAAQIIFLTAASSPPE